jgi:26S proteasome regulatory subunit N13
MHHRQGLHPQIQGDDGHDQKEGGDAESELSHRNVRTSIFVLQSSSRKMFFWMQEPKEDKDDEHCKKVNDYLNNPPAPGSAGRGSAGGGSGGGLGGGIDLSNLGDAELQSLLNNMNQQQLMQLFGGGMGGGAAGLAALLGGGGGSPASTARSRR